MVIRSAKKEDAAAIVSLLLLAMEEIVYEFIGSCNREKAIQFMTHFVEQETNQYSYENCWLAEESGEIVGAVIVYDGAQLHALRAPIKRYVENNYDRKFDPEDETKAGEYYIDSFGVDPKYQGKGIGTALLKWLIERYVVQQGKKIGLLVDKDNSNAKKLYLKVGFQVVGEQVLVGKRMEHLQIDTTC